MAALETALGDFPGSELHSVERPSEVAAALTGGSWDAIAYAHDPLLPDALTDLRSIVASAGEVPVVVLADAVGEYQVAAAMRAGAADFVLHGDVEAIGAVIDRLGGLADDQPRLVLRREADEALRIATARLRGAFDEAPIGMALVAMDGRFLKVNRALCAHFGYQERDLLGHDFRELTHPDDLWRDDDLARDLLNGEFPSYRIEKRYFHRRGPALWVDQSVSLVRDRHARPLHFIAEIVDINAARETTDALRDANARLKALFDNAPAWMTLSSLDGRFLDANQQLTRLLGTTRERLIGTYAGEHPGPAESLALDADDREVWERRAAVRREVTLLQDDGDQRTYHTVRYPVLDDAGEVSAIGSFAVDITDHKRSSEATERALADLNDAQRIAKLGSWTWDSVTGQTAWSAELFRIFERDPARGPGSASNFFDYVVPQERAQVKLGFNHTLMTHERLELDCTIRTDGGALRSVHVLGRPDPARPGVYAAIVQDVSALRTAEREAEAAQERFRRAFADAPVGVTISDLRGTFTQVNDVACRMLGYTREQMLTLSSRELLHPDDVEDSEATLVELRLGAIETYQRERRLRRADGEWLWVATHVTALRDAQGRAEHILGHLIDVSDRRAREHQLRHLVDHDPLTGLLNRRGFEQMVEAHLANVRSTGDRGAVLVVDLDDFKGVNDTLGHDAGDRLLVTVAGRVQDCVGAAGAVGRIGGDEFAVLLPDAETDAARVLAQQMADDLAVGARVVVGEVECRVTASIGLSVFHGDAAATGTVLIAADHAMYDAKEAGRGRVAYREPSRPSTQRARPRA